MSGNNLTSINKKPDYLENITLLDLSSNKIKEIDETVMEIIMKHVNHLDISRNYLKILPQTITIVNGTSQLWISNNPYECNCDMLWMKDWLLDTTSVQDKENVTCSTGQNEGKAINISHLSCMRKSLKGNLSY